MPTTTIKRIKRDNVAIQTSGKATSQIETQESSDQPQLRGASNDAPRIHITKDDKPKILSTERQYE